jgi:hypothetical protein
MIVYLTVLSFFTFTIDSPPPGAKPFLDTLLTTTSIVVGFYFATTGAIEVATIRQDRRGKEQDTTRPVNSKESRGQE